MHRVAMSGQLHVHAIGSCLSELSRTFTCRTVRSTTCRLKYVQAASSRRSIGIERSAARRQFGLQVGIGLTGVRQLAEGRHHVCDGNAFLLMRSVAIERYGHVAVAKRPKHAKKRAIPSVIDGNDHRNVFAAFDRCTSCAAAKLSGSSSMNAKSLGLPMAESSSRGRW